MARDDAISVDMGTTRVVPLSQAKLDQLAHARARSLEVRRRKAKEKLEARLSQLRHVLGADMRPDTVERVAKEMMAQESRLREKHASLIENLKTAINGFRDEMRAMRKLLEQPRRAQSTTSGSQRGAGSVLSIGTSSSRRS